MLGLGDRAVPLAVAEGGGLAACPPWVEMPLDNANRISQHPTMTIESALQTGLGVCLRVRSAMDSHGEHPALGPAHDPGRWSGQLREGPVRYVHMPEAPMIPGNGGYPLVGSAS